MIRKELGFQIALLTFCAACSVSCPAEDALNLPEGFSLSEQKWFVNDIDGTNCSVLHHEGHSFGHVNVAGIAGESLLVEKCYDPAETDFEGMRGSGWVDGWFLASPGNEELVPLEMEGLDRFSCPSTCGNIIAYWEPKGSSDRETGDNYFAYLADLSTQKVVLKQFLGKARIGGTDWRWYLTVPEWNEDCSEVLYQHEPHIKPVRIGLSGDAERTASPAAENRPRLRDSKINISGDGEVSNLPKGISISEPHFVGDWIDGQTTCYDLRIGEYSLGSITHPMRAGTSVLFQKCLYNDDDCNSCNCYYLEKGQECLHGSVWGWFVATQEDQSPRKIEGLGSFSNPIPCGSSIAYWSSKGLPDHDTNSEYFANVADASTGTLLRSVFVGQAWVATDNTFHLGFPRWNADCSEVFFEDARYFKSVRFVLSAKEKTVSDSLQSQD